MVSLQRIAIPLFYNSDKDKEFSFNFRQRREALINTDTRRFKIQTSDMGAPPPGRASINGSVFSRAWHQTSARLILFLLLFISKFFTR